MTEDNPQPKNEKTLEVLSCSAELYFKMKERDASAYEIIPLEVSYIRHWRDQSLTGKPLFDLKLEARRFGCDAITDLRQIETENSQGILIGIGLKLKQEEP